IRWGQERSDGGGVAFRTVEGQLFLLRSPLITGPELSLTVQPAVVTAGRTATVTVSLSAPAPAEGSEISLTSSNPALAAVPASITIAGGARSASFPVTTHPLSNSAPVVLTASSGGLSGTAYLTLWPSPL